MAQSSELRAQSTGLIAQGFGKAGQGISLFNTEKKPERPVSGQKNIVNLTLIVKGWIHASCGHLMRL